MAALPPVRIMSVNCRIGSLEMDTCIVVIGAGVNCRIGSLEISELIFDEFLYVNCRIGSLEKSVRPDTT